MTSRSKGDRPSQTSGSGRPAARVLGRYALYGQIASGGMAAVHLGRLLGPVGFSRTVAIKRLHEQFAKDPEFVAMFLDEARLAARVRHPNVVPTLDVVALAGELFLVMEYVHGESLSSLLRALRSRGETMPAAIVGNVMSGVLQGLHAAHDATSERGEPLGIVHRDVSPQNVLVGTDGVARVLDFGVAKAVGRLQSTNDGALKGKLAYMAPEQIRGGGVTARTDVFAAGVVTWEALTGRPLFHGENAGELMHNVLHAGIEPPSAIQPALPPAIDHVVMRSLERDPARRFGSAREMAIEIEGALPVVTQRQVGEWVERVASERLARRARIVADIEHVSSSGSGGAAMADPADHGAEPASNAVTDGGHELETAAMPARRRRISNRALSFVAFASAALASGAAVLVLGLRDPRGSAGEAPGPSATTPPVAVQQVASASVEPAQSAEAAAASAAPGASAAAAQAPSSSSPPRLAPTRASASPPPGRPSGPPELWGRD